MNKQEYIHIKGARVHNLKNVEVKIPRNKLVVITGLSGSGKSSLTFDTLYAEGQRRYVESLSSYARQFLGRMSKPEVDFIKGIPPAIAIEQRVNNKNPRSTVGTSTEIYEYIKLLYARIGKTFSPVTGVEVKHHQVEDVVKEVLQEKEGTKFLVLTAIVPTKEVGVKEYLQIFQQNGYTRVFLDDEIKTISDVLSLKKEEIDQIKSFYLLIDRLKISNEQDAVSRLMEAIETAFIEGGKRCVVTFYKNEGVEKKEFSNNFEADGMTFEIPNEQMFNFNNPLGACAECNGFGSVIGIDENLVIPNKSLSIYDDAVVCWRGNVMSKWKQDLIYSAHKFDFPIHTPYFQLTEKQLDDLWHGNEYFAGIDGFFDAISSKQSKIQYRVMLVRYRGKTKCPICKGSRLKKETEYVKVGGKSISELSKMSIIEIKSFFDTLKLNESDAKIAKRLLVEVKSRIEFLHDVGLGYLTLDRLFKTLSGGESQRVNLATSLGSSLVGSLYILDEPSIGLHPRDTGLLIKVLKQLRDIGNTVVVVEHEEEIMRQADYIIDIGKEAGSKGGEVIFQGDYNSIFDSKKVQNTNSYTLNYLLGKEKIDVPLQRRKWSNYIKVLDAHKNNLKNLNVKFPLNAMTVVTGVSGSGKSTLVNEIFYERVSKYLDGIATEEAKVNSQIEGSLHLIKNIELIDQNPIGRSSRSNPVIYVKAYDDIRKLFANQQLSKQMNYTPSFYSFNTQGGRCEECQGDGTVTIEMQFMADIVLECEHCEGKRFKSEILEVKYQNKNISDVLNMTIDDAIDFFSKKKETLEKRIVKRLQSLHDVGLGYVKMGQPTGTLSGGESQRLKLATFLANEKDEPTVFIFDEPTTGLHFHDIKILLKAFNRLIEKGHTIVIIEHNVEIMKNADHIIDLGKEGGSLGGNIVVEGTPEKVAKCEHSYTGEALNRVMRLNSKFDKTKETPY